MPKFIERPAQWLVRALMLRPGEAPAQLGDEVTPVVDTAQGGLAYALWDVVSFDYDSTSGQSSVLLVPDELKDRLVQLACSRTGAAADVDITVQLRGNSGATRSLNLFRERAFSTAGTPLTWSHIGNGQQWWFVPAGFELRILRGAAITAPDTQNARMLVGTIPKGCKPF